MSGESQHNRSSSRGCSNNIDTTNSINPAHYISYSNIFECDNNAIEDDDDNNFSNQTLYPSSLLNESQEQGKSNGEFLSEGLLEEKRQLLTDNRLSDYKERTSHTNSATVEGRETFSVDTREDYSEDVNNTRTTIKRESKIIGANSIPLVVTFLLQNSLSLASIFSVSRLGTKELGGVSLGSMTANITVLAAIEGLCTCLDTLCAQAYGAKKYHMVGIFVQRCAILTLLAFLPIIIIWCFWGESILAWIIPEKELCHLAAQYLTVLSIGIPGFILFECGKRFLQCQGIYYASTVVLSICAPLNAIMNYVLVWNDKMGIGYIGAPLSVSINYWFMTVGLLLYTIFTKQDVRPLKCWNGIIKPKNIFKNWKEVLNLALPGILMVEAEFLGFEILTIFASYLGTTALAAQSILSTITSLAYQTPLAISVTTSTRVANFIGASLWQDCRITYQASLLLSFFYASINMVIILLFNKQIASAFSTEEDIKGQIVLLLPILAFMQLFDAFNASTAGYLRGQGRQKIGGYINMFAFYAIGVPMAYFLTFSKHMGISGLWIGITTALVTTSIFQSGAVFNGNWQNIIDAAKSRTSEEES